MAIAKWSQILLLGLIICGCSAVRVSQDFDETINFTRYKTFDWAPSPPQNSNDILMDSQLMDRRVRSAVEEYLSAAGLSYTPGQKPDLFITYHIVVRTRLEGESFNRGFGWYGHRHLYWGYPYPPWGGINTYIRQYDEGTLIIDFADSGTNELIWRGVGSRRVSKHSDPEKTTAAVKETVAQILAQYPPLKKPEPK
jgi:hypothetical protein